MPESAVGKTSDVLAQAARRVSVRLLDRLRSLRTAFARAALRTAERETK